MVGRAWAVGLGLRGPSPDTIPAWITRHVAAGARGSCHKKGGTRNLSRTSLAAPARAPLGASARDCRLGARRRRVILTLIDTRGAEASSSRSPGSWRLLAHTPFFTSAWTWSREQLAGSRHQSRSDVRARSSFVNITSVAAHITRPHIHRPPRPALPHSPLPPPSPSSSSTTPGTWIRDNLSSRHSCRLGGSGPRAMMQH